MSGIWLVIICLNLLSNMIAHLILVHSKPEQLRRLVNKLIYKDDVVFIHVDLKSDLSVFEAALRNTTNIFFVQSRVDIKWGSYEMVEATINGFKEIISSGLNVDFVNLLSGQDYPLKSMLEFHKFLSENQGRAFMHCLNIENEWTEALFRIKEYTFNNWNFPGHYRLQQLINFVLPERKMPDGMIAVGRSQWFTISLKHVIFLVNRLELNPSLVRFFKRTWAPDEFIFQTLLFNSSFKEDIIGENLRYIDWSEGKENPKLLTTEDFNKMISSGNFFARKFKENDPVLDLIDKKLI